MQELISDAKMRGVKEAINLTGSIASITGVSLLWLRTFVPNWNLVIAVPATALASLVLLGLSSLGFLILRGGYKTLNLTSAPGKTSYIALAAALYIYFFGMLVYLLSTFVLDLVRNSHFS